MSIRNSLVAAAIALAAVPALTVAVVQPAAAQAAPAPQAQPRAERPSHVEGRLAFLKTELKITDAQSAQWNAFAAVMRQNDEARRTRMRQMRDERGQQTTVMQRLEAGERASTARAEEMRQFVAAFRPLYDSMSDDQKKAADELFSRHGGHHRMHGRF
jgi:periplasmic protein CpxP/Spy